MKKVVLFLIPVIIASCGPSTETAIKKRAEQWKMIYFKDTTTGLCFSAINYGKEANTVDYKTFNCVSCDSLKKVSVFKIGK
jgi:hypothetical protein